jgi:UDPglucose 6-dehydrogenase
MLRSYRISVIGMGYVGLCTAVAFASKDYTIIASETDAEKVDRINRGTSPFYEPGLNEALTEALRSGRFKCTSNTEMAVLDTDITFITVGTPSKPDGGIDLHYVKESAREVGSALSHKDSHHLVVVKSTVIPGTTENVVKPILEEMSGKVCGANFGLCANPEFLREGSALYDTFNPDRIIIGEYDKRSGDILETFYKEFYAEKTPPIIRTTPVNAELIKYANNAFLATKISFINTIANICERIPGADVTIVAKGIGLDKRIGPLFLNAGLGYGGSCLPKDLRALIQYSKTLGYEPKLLEAVEDVNKNQPQRAVELCRKLLGELKGRRIAVLGLAFKPNTDDMREAPSIAIIHQLLEERAEVVAYDPAAIPNAKAILKDGIKYANFAIECLKDADCCILVTEWEEFKKLKPEDFIQNMRRPILLDGRRIFDPKEFSQKIKFMAIGLGMENPENTEETMSNIKNSE